MARPSKQTVETIDKLEHAFSIGASVVEACFYADISEATYHRWCTEKPELKERFSALKSKPILQARQAVADALDSGDVATAKWYLERRKKDEFSIKTEIKGGGGASGSVIVLPDNGRLAGGANLSRVSQETLDDLEASCKPVESR